MLQLGSMLFVWITVGALQATLGSKYYDTSTPELGSSRLPGYIPPGQASYPPNSWRHHSDHPAKCNYKRSSSKDSCTNNFVSTFQEEVKASQILSDFFEYFDDLPAIEYYNGKYPEMLDILTKIKTPNPEFVARETVEAVVQNFDKLSSDIVIQVCANTIAKYLFTQGAITSQNSEKLAKQYAKMMVEAADSDDSPYAALTEGCVVFLESVGLLTPDRALLIAVLYGNEWKMAAKPKSG